MAVKLKNPFKKREKKTSAEKSDQIPRSTIIDNEKIEDIVDWVYKLVDQAKKERDADVADIIGKDNRTGVSFPDLMKEYENWDIGNHWENIQCSDPQDPDYRIENRTSQVLDVKMAITLANRPQITLTPKSGTAVEECEALQQINSTEFDDMDFDEHFRLLARNSQKYGTAIAKLHHIFSENEPWGKDVLSVCDPLSILWVGGADLEGEYKIKALIEVRERRKSEMEEQYRVKDLKSSGDIKDFDLKAYMTSSGENQEDVFEKVLEYNVWLWDITTEKTPVIQQIPVRDPMTGLEALDENGEVIMKEQEMRDSVTGEVIMEHKKKYPDGRLITVCGKTCLFDGLNPYSKIYDGHGLIPFGKLTPNPRLKHFYGMSDIQIFKDCQKEIDYAVTRTGVNAGLSANNQMLVDESALADGFTADDITNEPGAKFLTKPGKLNEAIKLLEQKPISSQTLAQYTNNVKAIEDLSGAVEIARGIAPSGDSGVKVRKLDAIATRRLQPFVEALETMAKRLAIIEIGNLFQFKGDEELYSITQKDTAMSKEVRWGDIKGKNFKYTMKVDLASATFSDRETKFMRMIQLRQAFPEIPAELAFKYCDEPALYEAYKNWQTQNPEQAAMLANMANMGQMPGRGMAPNRSAMNQGIPPMMDIFGQGVG